MLAIQDYPPALAIRDTNSRRHSSFSDLAERSFQANRLTDLLPNPDELHEHVRDAVNNAQIESLSVITNRKADEYYQDTPAELIAVVVPTFNAAGFISSTLDSIVAQDLEDVLILIVDDGSTDSTLDCVLRFMQTHGHTTAITLVPLPHVGIPAVGRNFALRNLLPTGTQFVSFMDGDDLYAGSGSLRTLVGELSRMPDAIAAYGDYDWINKAGSTIRKNIGTTGYAGSGRRWRASQILNWENLATGRIGVFHLQCLAVRTTAPFLPYTPRGEDAGFYARLFKLSSESHDQKLTAVRQIPEVLAHYRKHASSLTSGSERSMALRRRHSEADPYPKGSPEFYSQAGIPLNFASSRNLAEWALRQKARFLVRELRRNPKGIGAALKSLLNDRRIHLSDIFRLPVTLVRIRWGWASRSD